MKRFGTFLAESKQPRPAAVRESIRDGVIVLTTYQSGDIDDFDTELRQIPITKIVTRERGRRYDIGKLVSAYTNDPASVVPITVQKRYDGKYLVLDGHHRLQAAKRVGLDKVWVVEFVGRHGRGSDTPCTCGHTRRQHNGSLLFDGYADCIERNCPCQHFTPAK